MGIAYRAPNFIQDAERAIIEERAMSPELTEPQPPADPPPGQPTRLSLPPRRRQPVPPPPPSETKLIIGGMEVFVYGLDTVKTEIPRVMLFLLHGRGGTHADFDEFIKFLDLRSINRSRVKRQLLRPPRECRR